MQESPSSGKIVPVNTMQSTASNMISVEGGQAKNPVGLSAVDIDTHDSAARVDLNFNSAEPFIAGDVPILHPVDEDNLGEYVAEHVSHPSSCSTCARVTTCIAAGLTVVGLSSFLCAHKIIKPDEVGLARGFNGDIFYLGPGCHLVDTLLRDVRVFPVSDDEIHHHPFHIIRINPGFYGLCTIDGYPYIMMPGRHFINNPLFNFTRSVAATTEIIRNGTISIIIVPTGKVGIVSVKGVGHILEAGQHWINNPDFVFHQFVPANKEYIRAHAKHRIMIEVGKIGLAWKKNESVLLESNQTYYIDDPMFEYSGSVSLLDEIIVHGGLKIITVNKGLVGVAFNSGKLQILQPGRHVLDNETWNFVAMLSTGQETIPIREITNLSSDNVGLRFEAALNIQVIDAAKAVTMLGRDLSTVNDTREKGATEFSTQRLQNNIRDRARLALSIIVGNNPFTETFLATAAIASSNTGNSNDESFKAIIHDAFMAKFSKEMKELCGIRVIDMSIEDIKIVNDELAEALAQAAVKATELEMVRIDRDVEQQRAITAVNALKIRAEGEGRAKRLHAKASAVETEILTEAECSRIKDMDEILTSANRTVRTCQLIDATTDTFAASNGAIVVANDVQHLGEILSGNQMKK